MRIIDEAGLRQQVRFLRRGTLCKDCYGRIRIVVRIIERASLSYPFIDQLYVALTGIRSSGHDGWIQRVLKYFWPLITSIYFGSTGFMRKSGFLVHKRIDDYSIVFDDGHICSLRRCGVKVLENG